MSSKSMGNLKTTTSWKSPPSVERGEKCKTAESPEHCEAFITATVSLLAALSASIAMEHGLVTLSRIPED